MMLFSITQSTEPQDTALTRPSTCRTRMAIQQSASDAEVVEPRMFLVGFGGGPIEAVFFEARVAAARFSATSQNGVES